MPNTIDVPVWYAGLAIVALPAIGWLVATLRLTSKRDAVADQIADLQRLTDWTVPELPREPGHQPWPQPLSPRLFDGLREPAPVAAPVAIESGPAHAAPVAEPDWHRGENRTLTWRWWIEIAARIASIGYKPRLVEHLPAHAAWTSDDDAAVATLVATETKRRQSALERGIAQVLDDVIHMGGAR